MKSKSILVVVLAAIVAGCATVSYQGRPDLLAFLVDGRTTREEALIKLGEPSAEFAGEKIITYRLGFDERTKGYFVLQPTRVTPGRGVRPFSVSWQGVRYSLVLVFDERNVLRKHSLVEVGR